jgi:hypothetical protein
MLESGPGIGKSDSVGQYCAELSAKLNEPVGLVTFMLATISSVDVRGFMLPQKNAAGVLESTFSTPPWYPTLANVEVVEPNGRWTRAGQWKGEVPSVGVVFLDEFGQAEDDIRKAAAELMLKGRVGTCELPPTWRIMGAQNRMSDRSGVLRELLFLVNRRCLLPISPQIGAWVDWANRQPARERPHYMTISFARQHPDIVFKDAVPQGTEPFCTPRTLVLMDRDLRSLRSKEDVDKDRMPMDAVAREVAAGWIGQGAGAQYFTHLRYGDDLPEIDELVRDPSKAKLPPQRDAQMVISYMLAHHVTDKTGDAILKYIGRMQSEMQILAVRTILAQQEKAEIMNRKTAFTDWLVKNKNILMASRS